MKKDVIVFGLGKYWESKKETILNEDNKVRECEALTYGGINTVIRNPADICSFDEKLPIF